VLVESVELRDFRSYTSARLELGEGLTVLHGPNGAGKTNLLEALYCGCTGVGVRTRRDRELVRFGTKVAAVEVHTRSAGCAHQLKVVVNPGEGKVMRLDGRRVEQLPGGESRPLVSVFLADRLALVKGPPGGRRGHVDELSAALWPARRGDRRAYSQALGQRNALLASIRAGRATRESLPAWDVELAQRGARLCEGRTLAAEQVRDPLALRAEQLGFPGPLTLAYRPRIAARDAEGFVAELRGRVERDIEAGFCTHGPHRDELTLSHDGRDMRLYGSQGEQRLALLALLLAERDALAALRGSMPLMLLDDVMSELDRRRRSLLVRELNSGGQSVVTTTDAEHIPVGGGNAVREVAIPLDVLRAGIELAA
jgi:DNA replication and repair protein RecF